MTLSPTTKKNLHSLAVAAITGGLTYLTGAFASGQLPGLKALGMGVAVGAGGRVAGWLLARVETAQ